MILDADRCGCCLRVFKSIDDPPWKKCLILRVRVERAKTGMVPLPSARGRHKIQVAGNSVEREPGWSQRSPAEVGTKFRLLGTIGKKWDYEFACKLRIRDDLSEKLGTKFGLTGHYWDKSIHALVCRLRIKEDAS